jgi:hypothetical protein
MSSRTENSTQEEELNFDFYLKHDIPAEQVRSILKHKKMNEDKIEETVQKLSDARERVKKYARKFIEKIDQYYGLHDVPAIVKKAAKFAEKHELTNVERDAIVALALKGDVNNTFNPLNQLKHSEMSKFMGIESPAGQVLNIQSKDYQPLNEIVKLFETSRIIHTDIKNQLSLYRECAMEAVNGQYDKNRANLSIHIHPVVVALFLPKIDAIEKRMLYTNIGRVVLQRALPYINRHIQLWDNVMPGELESEWELTCDFVTDPNSLQYFTEDTPVTNMLKRFTIQIELWKNVLNLRQGRYYSLGSYGSDDGINGLLRVLSQYDWSYFDSPDMYHIQDEGSVLRKLLAVFSFRPTFARIDSITTRNLVSANANYSGLQRTTFLNIPIVNVRIPSVYAVNAGSVSISLNNALSQSDFFIEHKSLVPKSKSVMYSKDVVFFYVNRRYQAVNYAHINTCRFSYTSLPYQTWNVGQAAINFTPVLFDPQMEIGNTAYKLRSLVTVYRPPVAENITAGSSCVVLKDANTIYYYNPLLANYAEEVNGQVVMNAPISTIPYQANGPDDVCVENLGQKFATIFVYASQ